MMLDRGLISVEDLDQALQDQRGTGRRMGETLVEMGVLSDYDLARVLAERLGYEFVDLSVETLDVVVTNLIPEEVARRYQALPIRERDGRVVVAMASPHDVFALDDLRVLTDSPVVAVMAAPTQLFDAIDRSFARTDVESSLDEAVSEAHGHCCVGRKRDNLSPQDRGNQVCESVRVAYLGRSESPISDGASDR